MLTQLIKLIFENSAGYKINHSVCYNIYYTCFQQNIERRERKCVCERESEREREKEWEGGGQRGNVILQQDDLFLASYK